MSRYLVGIDLGTTNIAVAYVDTASRSAGGPKLHTFKIPQVVAAGQVQELDLLPSFLYIPGPHDLPPGAIDLPWEKNPPDTVGLFARNHGAKVPGRQVSSAKSWLCHPGVDRTAPLLPWSAPPDVPRLSPLEVSAKFLKHIVQAWNHAPGRQPTDFLETQEVVVTVPASFDDVARNLTAEAARLAGLKNVTLLEEPQAAFYAWLGTHSPQEAAQLRPGMRCLVVDVGGGTSDFSLIRAGEEQGELTFLRDAVGDHLLLGGDNMDLALAKAVETKLPGGRLDAAQFGALVQACRAAKEALLANPPPPSYPVTVMGKGRAVVGGTVSVNLKPDEVRQTIFEGFFPLVPRDAEPSRTARVGLQEMGLPYVADPAITKHLAAFVRQHLHDFQNDSPSAAAPRSDTIDAILFNGGVFQPEVLRQRVIDVMRPWFTTPPKRWEPLILTSPSLDLAVSWGAAYFAWLKHSGGRRIGGGIPRSYYIAIETDTPGRGSHAHSLPVLCVVPRRMQEGDEVRMPEPVLQLALGQPVLFPLYSSTVRGDDKPGQLLRLPEQSLLRLPPLHTILRGGKRTGVKHVPVTLAAKCTEIGTLELYCEAKEGNRWRLEFNVRDVLREPTQENLESDPNKATVIDVFPEEKVQAAGELIRQVFASAPRPAGATPPTPAELPKRLEAVLEAARTDWPTGLCRRLWEFLEENASGRSQSPQHLARWYNLTGFVLRPGFGDPLDRYRVESLWKLITAAASSTTTTKKGPIVPEGGADYWIMWRRVCGGLNTALQQQLFTRLKPALLPVKGKQYARPAANEFAEMWRAAASLERLDAKTKESLGSAVLRDCKQSPVPTYAFWSLTRLGARVQLYGPLNTVVHPEIVEQWIAELLPFVPGNESEKNGWLFCLSQLARLSGWRAVDVSDTTRYRVLGVLRSHACPGAWKRMVEEVVAPASDEQSQLFGESLPIGLRLSAS
ncbi:MAG: Hsp70 family protein [Gemmataceae bacterium]|nr:hsp70 family protein [Gemmata sp.]MDW8198767.1 Hsp70 family protein [Gemmataceae bacterium]